MAKKLTAAERDEKSEKAYTLSALSVPNTEIAKQIGVSRNTVATLIQREAERRREENPDAVYKSLATYAAVMRHAWERLDGVKKTDSPIQAAGLLNTIITARSKMDVVEGLIKPAPNQTNVQVNIRNDISEAREERFGRLYDVLADAPAIGNPPDENGSRSNGSESVHPDGT